jgi:uncharacterized RDD family membrane protein YckC
VQLEERLRIDTPEQIALELPVAGIGSRFLAVAIDTVLQVALMVGSVLALALGLREGRLFAAFRVLGPAVSILFTFCVYWGYFAFFEILWSGRTPGKRVAGIRVIDASGRPLGAYGAIARNVLRVIDFLPALYAAGVVVMMLNRQSRRIGDFVAGTVVVYDMLGDKTMPDWQPGATAEVPRGSLARVSANELQLIETYLVRRADLDEHVRDQLADQIVRRIQQQAGIVRKPEQSADAFLESVAQQVRDEARFR